MVDGEIPSSPIDISSQTWVTLPSHDYFDPDRYQQELEQIWYRNWLYVCRAEALKSSGDFRTFEIGSQNIVVLRDETGQPQAFHNTCRHRGSILCPEKEGNIKTRRIVCQYHQWSYSLQGKLAGVPFLGPSQKYLPPDLGLYQVAVREWNGCIFVNLDDENRPFEQAWNPGIDELANWPLVELVLGHTFTTDIECNWKVFWENFEECYHCPGVHPELCELVPLYKRGVTGTEEIFNLQSQTHPLAPGLRQDAETWSMDGQIHGIRFENLTEDELNEGHKFLVALPGVFLIGHPDYVRLVSIFPLGPERIRLTAEWLFPAETLNLPSFEIHNVTDFGTIVMKQDGHVCELNQRGLHSIRHEHGILVPHEYDVHLFQDWVRREMRDL